MAGFAYAYLQLRKMDQTERQLATQIDKDKKILLALNPLLTDFGWSGDKLPQADTDLDRIRRSVEADDELSRLSLSEHPPKAWNTSVLYFKKDIDGSKVAAALSDFGFHFQEETPLVPDLPCDDIVFGADVSPDSAKIVAYALIRAGVDIKGLHLSNFAAKSASIQVIANRIVADGPPLSVADIEKMTVFELDPIITTPQ
jgi:hypothetical protein